jgi:hypothetical protein
MTGDVELVWACEVFATAEDFALCDCDCEFNPDDEEHVALLEAALIAASDELTLLSGHTVRGICEQTVTVCRQRCFCGFPCGCMRDRIILPGPIVSVSNVVYDGYTFAAEDFVIIDDIGLAWADSASAWPSGVDIEITYTFGHPIDQIAKRASLELGCVAVRKCLTDRVSLGEGVQQVQRQGITIARRSVSATASTAERTAADYPWLAKFLTLYNPTRAFMPPSIYSPDFDDDVHVIRAL